MTRLEKFLDDYDPTLIRMACDSESTKMNEEHH